MANTAPATFNIPATPIAAGTTQEPFSDVTAAVAGHTAYEVGADVSAWPSTANISIGVVFRIDGTTIYTGCVLTTTGGVHHDMSGNLIDPECGGPIPAHTSKLETALTITVPSSANMSGFVSLF